MPDGLSILIKSKIDQSSAAVKELEDQIKQLSTQIKEAISVKLQIDAKQLEVLTKDIEKVQHKYKKILAKPIPINTKLEVPSMDELEKELHKIKANVDRLSKIDLIADPKTGHINSALITYKDNMGAVVQATLKWNEYLDKADNTIKRVFKVQPLKLSQDFDKSAKELAKVDAVAKETIGTFASLKNQEVQAVDIAKVLSQEYGKLEIRGHSLNKTTGDYTVTLKQSAKENLVLKGNVDKTTGALRVQSEVVQQAKNVQLGFIEQLKIAINRTFTWALAMTAFYGSLRSFREGVSFIKDLDKDLTQVSVITGITRDQARDLAKEYANISKEMKITVLEVSKVNTELIRQGLSLEEAQKRMEVILKLSRAGSMDIEQATKTITSSVNALRVDAEQAADVLLLTGAISASSVEEISEAFTKTASSARSTGMSIIELAAILGGLIETTQESPSSLGTFTKTLLARFNRINEETGELNEELNNVQTAFESVGVAFLDGGKQIRPVYDLLSDLNVGWKDLEKNTKMYIATQAAGARGQNRFLAIMDNFNRIQEINNELTNAGGTLNKQYARHLSSVEAAADGARAALDEMWINALNSDSIKYFYQLSESLITAIDNIGLFNVAMTTLTTILLLANKRYSEWISSLLTGASATLTTKGLVAALGEVFNITQLKTLGLTIAVEGLKIALTLGLSVAITALIAGITNLITAKQRAKEATEKFVDTTKNEIDKLTDLKKKYNDLIEKQKDGVDVLDSLKKVEKEILNLLPQKQQSWQDELEARQKINDEIDKEITKKRELIAAELRPEVQKIFSKSNWITGMFGDSDFFQDIKMVREYEKIILESQKLFDKYKEGEWISGEVLQKESPLLAEYLRIKNRLTKESQQSAQYSPWNLSKYDVAGLIGEKDKIIPDLEKDLKTIIDYFSNKYGVYNEEFIQLITDTILEGQSLQSEQAIENVFKNYELQLKDMYDPAKGLDEPKKQDIFISSLDMLDRDKLKELLNADKITLEQYYSHLLRIRKDLYSEFIDKSADELYKLQSDPTKAKKVKEFLSLEGEIKDTRAKLQKDDKSLISQQKLTSELIESFKIEVEKDKIQTKSLERQIKLAEQRKDYNKTIELSNQLLENQRKTIDDIKIANQNIHEEANRMRAKYPQYDTELWFTPDGKATKTYIDLVESFEGRSGDAAKKELDTIKYLFSELSKLKGAFKDNNNEIISIQDNIDSWLEKVDDFSDKKIAKQFSDFEDTLKPIKDELQTYKDTIDYLNEQLKHAPEDKRANILDSINFFIGKQIEKVRELKDTYEEQLPLFEDSVEYYDKIKAIISDYILEIVKLINVEKDNIETKKKDIEVSKQKVDQQKKEAKELIDSYRNYIVEGINEEIEALEKSKRAAKDAADAKIAAIQKQIEILERQNAALKEQEDREKRLSDLAKQREKVANIEKNRDTRMLIDGEWVYVANPRKLREETERLAEMEEDYIKWERDLKDKKVIEDLRSQIKAIQDSLKEEEKGYDKRIEQLREFIKDQNKLWNRQEDQITSYEQLLDRLSEYEKEIYIDRLKELDNFVSEYNKLTSTLSPIPSTSSGGSTYTPTSSNSNYVQMWHPQRKIISTAHKNIIDQRLKEGWTLDVPSDRELAKILASIQQFDTGGYTGVWGKGGKLAIVDEKELVLKQDDTTNLLKGITMLRDIVPTLKSIQFKVPKLEFPKAALAGAGATNYYVNINKVETPDAESFMDLVPTLALQYRNKR